MSSAREEEAGRADDARGAELRGPRLVAVRVVDVSVRNDERDPQLTLRIDGSGTDDRLNERDLAVFHSSRRPRRWLRRHEIVDLTPFDMPLEHQLPGGVVFAEHRLPGEKDVIEAACRIHE